MEQRLSALDLLSRHQREPVRLAFEQRVEGLRQIIAREHEHERSTNRERDVSFE